MATLVYIHGESYEWNSGNLYDGTVLAAHSNIIVVTINFRLGVLGELSLVISHICLSISALKLEIGHLRNFSITFNSPSSSLYGAHACELCEWKTASEKRGNHPAAAHTKRAYFMKLAIYSSKIIWKIKHKTFAETRKVWKFHFYGAFMYNFMAFLGENFTSN